METSIVEVLKNKIEDLNNTIIEAVKEEVKELKYEFLASDESSFKEFTRGNFNAELKDYLLNISSQIIGLNDAMKKDEILAFFEKSESLKKVLDEGEVAHEISKIVGKELDDVEIADVVEIVLNKVNL